MGINKPTRKRKGMPDERTGPAGAHPDQKVHFIRNGQPLQEGQDVFPENNYRDDDQLLVSRQTQAGSGIFRGDSRKALSHVLLTYAKWTLSGKQHRQPRML